ncbi:MAG: hypothetical protein ABRQ37_03480 [Candidatus Eremiobacterota bacterium]
MPGRSLPTTKWSHKCGNIVELSLEREYSPVMYVVIVKAETSSQLKQ